MKYERNSVWHFSDAVCISGSCHGGIWKHPQHSCCPVSLRMVLLCLVLADLEAKYSLNSSVQEKKQDILSLYLCGGWIIS